MQQIFQLENPSPFLTQLDKMLATLTVCKLRLSILKFARFSQLICLNIDTVFVDNNSDSSCLIFLMIKHECSCGWRSDENNAFSRLFLEFPLVNPFYNFRKISTDYPGLCCFSFFVGSIDNLNFAWCKEFDFCWFSNFQVLLVCTNHFSMTGLCLQ